MDTVQLIETIIFFILYTGGLIYFLGINRVAGKQVFPFKKTNQVFKNMLSYIKR